jgi:hypothetical protein
MKKQMYIAVIVFGVMMALAWPVIWAGGGNGGSGGHVGGGHGGGGGGHGSGDKGHEGSGHSGNGNSPGMNHSGHDMDRGGHSGMKIHTATVDGYELRYELIDMKARMEGMENMPEMQHSHHMMVYVRDRDGNAVESAKVGYLIQGPGGDVQKAMCMGMGGGYGADVSLEDAGAYTIKTKVVAGDKTLMDGFEYEVK